MNVTDTTHSSARVCVSIAGKSVNDALERARLVAEQADVIEIRVDSLDIPVVVPFRQALALPLLVTNRPVWEGGYFEGSEEERLAPLLEAVEVGCEFVDIELKAPDSSHRSLLAAVEKTSCRLLLSWHNFQETPSSVELLGRLALMQDKGAHVAKIVTMAHNHHDVLRVLMLQEDAARMGIDLVAFCMGRPGVISRLATLELGGYMTYCAASEGEATAPGQLAVTALRQIETLMGLQKVQG